MSQPPALIVVMGASGCGKSTIGTNLAKALQAPFVDGDDLHPKSNVDKMSRGEPLNDQDRIPWLHSIRLSALLLTSDEGLSHLASPDKIDQLEAPHKDPLTFALKKVSPATLGKPMRESRPVVVVGCSALRVPYRELLRGKEADMGQGVTCEADEKGPDSLEAYFIYLDGTRELLLNRMSHRQGHFMKAGMLDSQLATLEKPTAVEGGVATVKLGMGENEVEERGEQAVSEEVADVARAWVGQN